IGEASTSAFTRQPCCAPFFSDKGSAPQRTIKANGPMMIKYNTVKIIRAWKSPIRLATRCHFCQKLFIMLHPTREQKVEFLAPTDSRGTEIDLFSSTIERFSESYFNW